MAGEIDLQNVSFWGSFPNLDHLLEIKSMFLRDCAPSANDSILS